MDEEWRSVVGFPRYEVSTSGLVRSLYRQRGFARATPKVLRPNVVCGYHQVSLSRGTGRMACRKVHQLVLEAFVGPRPPGHDACHNDGSRDNNHLGNLRWATKVSNMADKVAHGTVWRQPGEKCPTAKLTWSEVRAIRAAFASGVRTSSLAISFGVSRRNIRLITTHRTWVE